MREIIGWLLYIPVVALFTGTAMAVAVARKAVTPTEAEAAVELTGVVAVELTAGAAVAKSGAAAEMVEIAAGCLSLKLAMGKGVCVTSDRTIPAASLALAS